MKIGVCSANSGPYATPARLRSVAELCEATGVESIWVSEHLVLSDPRTPPSPMDPEDPILDPVTSLAFLAGITSSVRLGTGVIVLPLRNPLVLAKALATVDVVSQGRLIVGLGAGYVEREFAAIGVPFTDRGARFEEYLAAMQRHGLAAIPMFSPRTPDARLAMLARAGSGLVYVVAREGVTGATTRFGESLEAYLGRCRAATTLPLAVGFGIAKREDVDFLRGKADIAVVGSQTLRVLDAEGIEGAGAFLRGLRGE